MHGREVAPHGRYDLLRPVAFHEGRETPQVGEKDGGFPPLTFKWNPTGKDLVPDFGRHVSTKGVPDHFALCEALGHSVACISQHPDLVIADHADACAEVPFPDSRSNGKQLIERPDN